MLKGKIQNRGLRLVRRLGGNCHAQLRGGGGGTDGGGPRGEKNI